MPHENDPSAVSSGSSPELPVAADAHADQLTAEAAELQALAGQPLGKRLKVYTAKSGPGWLQGAITLGGGSLSSSLYLGVLAGFGMLWLQPLAIILGIVMLSAIAYVTLSTGERPFKAINDHVNPVLGWGWLIATMMANLVWSMPQYSLGDAAIRQNLFVGVFAGMDESNAKLIVCGAILALAIIVMWSYGSEGRGFKLFELVIKLMVAMIVLCFFGVVIRLSVAGGLDWGAIGRGIIPDLNLLSSPAETFTPFLNAVDEQFRTFWSDKIVSQQRDVMISAIATAVGINMTFMLPYSMLRKGWGRAHRGLAIFDLSFGLFIPFTLATGCVIIASASQFHTVPAPGLVFQVDAEGQTVQADGKLLKQYNGLLTSRSSHEIGAGAWGKLSEEEQAAQLEQLPEADKTMAAMLVTRDAFHLAAALAPLTGTVVSQYIFGFGVLGMAVSTIIVLMLINGFVLCEALNKPNSRAVHRAGCLICGVSAMGPFYWSKAALWLAIPTSVFGMVLLPIAYFTFYFLMNQKSLLGENMPRGSRRLLWNLLMAVAAGFAFACSLWVIWSKAQWKGIAALGVFTLLVVVVGMVRKGKRA